MDTANEVKLDSSLGHMNFQTQVTADRLKREYELMRQLLVKVTHNVENIMFRVARCTEIRPLGETSDQVERLRFIECKEIRRQLEMAILDLKAIQIDNGREHRYLKALQEELKKADKSENQDLQEIVDELNKEHEYNSLLKKEVDKMISLGKERISKVKSPHRHQKSQDVSMDEDDFSFLAHSYKLE